MTTVSRCSCGTFVLDGGVVPTANYLHGPAQCVRTTPLFPTPDAFVKLSGSSLGGEQPEAVAEPLVVHTNSVRMLFSREMLIDAGMILPTPEEQAQRDAELAAYRLRRDAERAGPGPELTIDAMLELLGWSEAYAVHALHPACSCDWGRDAPYLCDWAQELGFTEVGGTRP